MSKKILYLNYILLIIHIIIEESISSPFLKNSLIRLLQQEDEDDYNPEKFNSRNSLILFNLYDQFNKYFKVNNTDINTKECHNFIFNDLVLDYNYNNLFYYSGHKLADIGSPVDCLNNNYTFLLPLFTFEINENSIKEEDKLSYFASKNKANIGFCIWNQCNKFIEENLVNNLDTKFKLSMEKIYNIKDMKITYKFKEMKYEYSLGIKVFEIFVYIYILFYILIKLIVWIYNKYKESTQIKRMRRKDYLNIDEN